MGVEEVNLRDLIEVLLRARWLIVGVTVVAMVISGAVSFMLPPTYEATANILVNNPTPTPKPATEPGLDQLLSRLSSTPTMTLETYRMQVTNPAVLTRVIEGLRLHVSPSALASHIQVKSFKDTGILQIVVTDRDPVTAAGIANRVVDEYQTFVTGLTREQMQKSGQFLNEQMLDQEKQLSTAMDELKTYLQQSPSAEILQKEIDAKADLLATLKTTQVELGVSIAQAEAGAQTAAEALANAPTVTITKKSILDDSLMKDLAGSVSQQDLARLAGLQVQSEEVNTAHADLTVALAEKKVTLAEALAQRDALERAIAATEKDLESLRAEQVTRQIAQDKLQQKVDFLKQAYDAIAQKYEETRINAASQYAEVTLSIANKALVPDEPTGPNKMLNIALAGVLGLMASVFLAFFMDFWRKSAPTSGRAPVSRAGGLD